MMAQQWQPHPQAIEQLISMIRSTLSGGTPELQHAAHLQLQNYRQVPDFCNYLVFIFAKRIDLSEEIRFAAAMLLKNLIQHQEYYKQLSNEVRNYIRNEIVTVLADDRPGLRRTCANVISAICCARGLEDWPGLIEFLIRCLESSDLRLIDGAFITLRNICEDCGRELLSGNIGKPVNALVPRLLQFLRSPHESHRVYALECLNNIVYELPAIIVANMDEFVQNLFYLTNDMTVPVRLRLCRTFVSLIHKDCSYVEKWLKNFVDFMLICNQDKNPSVAMEACEFWTALSDHPDACYKVVRPILDKLIPILLNGLVYSEEELLSLGAMEADSHIPDREEDIKPQFYPDTPSTKGTQIQQHKQSKQQQQQQQQSENGDDDDGDDEDFEDADSEEDQNQGETHSWSLRKSSGQALDALSYVFHGEILFTLLPNVEAMIKNENWLIREAAVLSLGAVASGAYEDVLHYLPNLIPSLLQFLQDQHYLIRTITLWTLGRYGKMSLKQKQDEKLFQMLLQNIMPLTLDNNKKVQEAAMSALATLIDIFKDTDMDPRPYLDAIVSVFVHTLPKYQARNKLVLWDAIGTLAEAVGNLLNQPKYVEAILPPLMQSLNELRDDDHRLFPLLETISVLAKTLGIGFQKYAGAVYSRCVKIVERTFIAVEMAKQNPDMEKPNRDFIVAGLDVIISLAEGLGPGFESLIANSNLIGMIIPLAKDTYFQIQQSIFALIGELAQWAMAHIRPLLNELIPFMISCIHEEQYLVVINNSVWALGEMAVQLQQNFRDAVIPLLERLVPIINQEGVAPNLVENITVCLGRMALVCPDEVAPHFPKFVRNWLKGFRMVHDRNEKESSFRGLICLLERRPQDVLAVEDFQNLCRAIVSWKQPSSEMRNIFFNVLHTYKNVIIGKQNWDPVYKQFPDELKQQLKEMYQID